MTNAMPQAKSIVWLKWNPSKGNMNILQYTGNLFMFLLLIQQVVLCLREFVYEK